jgi:hypothetical protein
MRIITKIEDFLKENLNIIDRNEIENLFRKYDQLYKPEFDENNQTLKFINLTIKLCIFPKKNKSF